MKFFRPKPVRCPAGEWTRVIYNFGKGYPEDMRLVLVAADGTEVTGEYEETHYDWIFPKKPVTGPLAPEMVFHRRWIDGIYSVHIKPDVECVAEVA